MVRVKAVIPIEVSGVAHSLQYLESEGFSVLQLGHFMAYDLFAHDFITRQ